MLLLVIILAMCEKVYGNLKWMISTGNTINISTQSWLNEDDNPYITTDTSILYHNDIVAIIRVDHRE